MTMSVIPKGPVTSTGRAAPQSQFSLGKLVPLEEGNIDFFLSGWDNTFSYKDSRSLFADGLSNIRLAGSSDANVWVLSPLEVEEFFAKHKGSRFFLDELLMAIRKVFASERISVDIYEDVEREEEDELAVYVQTTDEPEVALRKLNRFDEAFWFNHQHEWGSRFSVNLEYSGRPEAG